MPLEPVYADSPAPGARGGITPGAVPVRADRVQLIGVAREQVRTRTLRHNLRLLGTVSADETRLFRISAATKGLTREMGPATTGSLVGQGDVLASYYTQEVAVPQQNYIRILQALQVLKQTGQNPYDNLQGGGQLAAYEKNLQTTRQTLMNLGMSPEQIEEIGRKGFPAPLVQIRAPAAGFVTARNISLGESFVEGKELYTIAGLDRVWILGDAFEGQERFFIPGMPATVTLPGTGQTLTAEVSEVLPWFDTGTRTLKIRLVAGNSGFVLRPGMFVDIEIPVEAGPGIFLPKEAVLDSGKRRAVFVEQDEGVFVPRTVRTGQRVGEQIEIVAGLMEGETVVTSGNFLLDSESQMRSAGATAATDVEIDPICGMEVEKEKALARGLVSERGGATWFFCSPICKEAFDSNKKVAGRTPGTPKQVRERVPHAPPHEPEPGPTSDLMPQPMPGGKEAGERMEDASFKRDWAAEGQRMPDTVDPVCGMVVEETKALANGLVSLYEGKIYMFCSSTCKQEFDRDPSTYVQTSR
jgi:YHS domain-containing protein